MSRPSGFHHSPETRARIGAAHIGRPKSPEARAKLKATLSTPEARARRRAALIGRPRSPETRAKLSAAASTPEARARTSARKMGNRNVLNASVKGNCVYCDGPATTHDHVIPRGRPGWNDPANIVLACHPCNASKGSRTPEEWFDAM